MFQQIINWRVLVAIIAILIVSGTIVYSRYLANKIAIEEKQKVEEWVAAGRFLMESSSEADTRLPFKIIQNNENDVPIIETNEKDSIIQFINLDSLKIAKDPSYLNKKLRSFKSQNEPIVWTNPLDSTQRNLYYYGESRLLIEVRYYPIVQLIIVGLFIIITLLALRSSYRSAQNQVWAGMAKETAHQLGTPVTSLEGWIEMLRQNPSNDKIVGELEKDIGRLQLITDRFGKIGSKPQLEKNDIVSQVTAMVDYMRKRAPGKVSFSVNTGNQKEIFANISPPLFDWVIENLLKNSLDAMEGTGEIKINIESLPDKVNIDLKDTGKGIPLSIQQKVFKPGFTTKKRGWGLGLSLSKRIIEQYHKGEIFVKSSDPGKGTTFRIVLKK
ncbi:MAG TPA: HAMP domain-containing sensor histidine kinase [Chitinophagaceae bacterium]|nr:HAMP domain-containing sensor histidine kinase [Chitinophagaceae bacterium]